MGCVLPTCAQGLVNPSSRRLGVGENKWILLWGLVLLLSILVFFLLVNTWIDNWERHRHSCRRPSHLAGHFPSRGAAACAGMLRAFVGLVAFLSVLDISWHFSCASEFCFPFVEGSDRHIVARSLCSGIGEQAPRRMDVPGKGIQQQAAAAKETPSICFFVKSLGGASYVVKMEHQATVARFRQHVALKSGVCEDAFHLVREGKVI